MVYLILLLLSFIKLPKKLVQLPSANLKLTVCVILALTLAENVRHGQCDQIGQFLKILCGKISNKNIPKDW